MGLMVALAGNTRNANSASCAPGICMEMAKNDNDEMVENTNRLVIINTPNLMIIDMFDF